MSQEIKEIAKKAQDILLQAVYMIFKNNPQSFFGPSDITQKAGLFKRLNSSGRENDRLAQALINELLNRDKIYKIGRGQYKIKDR